MRTLVLKYWERLRASYWFIPTLMALGAIAASFGLTAADEAIGAKWLDEVSWLYANKPSGARALLSTIAGSMITVAGVTFSITIAAVAYATSQFGPRLLTNFMRDRGNQITMGTFIATFLYCLLVLRTIRSAEESPPNAEAAGLASAFVPHIALLFALLLTLASLGVLIYFIHHIPESIHAFNVIANIGHELNRKIEQLFPEMIGEGGAEEAEYDPQQEVPEGFLEEAVPIRARYNGYLQYLNEGLLLETARERDLLLRVQYRPGDFVNAGKPLVLAWPPARINQEAMDAVGEVFVWGRQRTQRQDLLFLVNEPVEVAARALSPGVNDPFTAMNCLDWLGSALANLGRRRGPSAFRYDDEGRLRVIARPVTFEEVADAIFDQLRPYVAADRNAALHTLKVIGEVVYDVRLPDHQAVLRRHATALRGACDAALTHPDDRAAVEQRYRTVLRLLQDGKSRVLLGDGVPWLAGSG